MTDDEIADLVEKARGYRTSPTITGMLILDMADALLALQKERDEWKRRCGEARKGGRLRQARINEYSDKISTLKGEKADLAARIAGVEQERDEAWAALEEARGKLILIAHTCYENSFGDMRDPPYSEARKWAREGLAAAVDAQQERDEARAALVDHNDLLRSAFQAAQRDATHDVVGTTNYRLLADRSDEVLARHHRVTNEARAALSAPLQDKAGTALLARIAEVETDRDEARELIEDALPILEVLRDEREEKIGGECEVARDLMERMRAALSNQTPERGE